MAAKAMTPKSSRTFPVGRNAETGHLTTVIPFKMSAIRFALDNWPQQFRSLDAAGKSQGPRRYTKDTLSRLAA